MLFSSYLKKRVIKTCGRNTLASAAVLRQCSLSVFMLIRVYVACE